MFFKLRYRNKITHSVFIRFIKIRWKLCVIDTFLEIIKISILVTKTKLVLENDRTVHK